MPFTKQIRTQAKPIKVNLLYKQAKAQQSKTNRRSMLMQWHTNLNPDNLPDDVDVPLLCSVHERRDADVFGTTSAYSPSLAILSTGSSRSCRSRGFESNVHRRHRLIGVATLHVVIGVVVLRLATMFGLDGVGRNGGMLWTY